MKTRIVEYLDGEDTPSLELFEPLHRHILDNWKAEKDVALVLPCSWGKPYVQSVVGHNLYRSLYIASQSYLKIATTDRSRRVLRDKGVVSLLEPWHMSTCGFVPFKWQSDLVVDGKAPFAYNWNSARASLNDVEDWFEFASRRTQEWAETFIGQPYKVVCHYFRYGSKSKKLIDEIVTPIAEARGCRVVNCNVVEGAIEDESRVLSELSLGGLIPSDPDFNLLIPMRLATYGMMVVAETLRQYRLLEVKNADSD